MTDKFNEDKAESLLNTSLLEQEFGLNTTDERNNQIEEIRNMRRELEKAKDFPDAEKILHDNIQRANRLLDTVESEVSDGQINARLFEVAAQLINAITSATTSITGNIFHDQKHEYNMKMLEVKEREVAVKQAMTGGSMPSGSSTNNLLVTDRESLLKLLKGEGEEEKVVNSQPEEE